MKRTLASSGRLVFLCMIALTTRAALADSVSASNEQDVLVIEEAAQVLRMHPGRLRALAAAERVPARNIGGEWRFSRAALLEWLKGDRRAGTTPLLPGTADGGVKASPAMPRADLRAVTGAGAVASEQPERIAQTAPPVAAEVGEKPTAKTAEEIALRDQGALLKKGATTLELGLAYSRSERQNFPVLRTEDTAFAANLTARQGIRDDLQVTARLPGVYRRSTIQIATGPSTVQEDKTTDQYVGDLSASLLGVAMREGVGRPTIVWSLDTVLPTGPGDKGLGAGAILAKSYDPLVLFAGLSYLHGYAIEPSETRRQLASHNWRLTLGYTYALNDTIALNSLFVGYYRSDETPSSGVLRPSRERYLLQLGMTWMLGRGLFVEPAVAIGLGGAAPDFTFSLNFPYTF